jgi:hypothetical protein
LVREIELLRAALEALPREAAERALRVALDVKGPNDGKG